MSTFRVRLPLVHLAFIAALPLGIGAQLTMAHAQVLASKNSVPIILTHGVAGAEVVPDIAIISLGVDTERPKAADAARDNARAVQAMIGEIKAQGIEAKDIYIAHNSFGVRIRDIEKAGVLAGQLLDKGANRFEGIAFDYSQREVKYNALLGDAVRDALRKANSYVNGLGLKLGRVLEILGQTPEDYPSAGIGGNSAKRLAAQAVPVEPGSEVLRTEVRVTWELAQ